MKRSVTVSTLALVVCFFPLCAHSQEAAKPESGAKAAPSASQALLTAWNDIGRKLTAMAEDFPENRYDFKPVPAERTFAEQLLHAANANYFFIKPAMGQAPPPEEDPKRDQYKSKAAVVAFVKKSFEDGAAVIRQKGDAGMNDLLTDPFSKQQERVSDMAWSLLEHCGEHYGQLVVYYRVAGLVPPESRPHK